MTRARLEYVTAEGVHAPVRDAGGQYARVPSGWASAGIVDARAFTVGASELVHFVSSAWPNQVSGLCGVTAPLVEVETSRVARWADAYVDCPRCVERMAATAGRRGAL